jgi:protein-S-isoprenylcysteine O-methyltransferase Ste14
VSKIGSLEGAWTGPSGANVDRWVKRCLRSCPVYGTEIVTILLIPGVVLWLWSVVLILLRVPQKKLITDGPYALVKHPLYTAVALLVLPWLGFLLDSWLGVVVGLAIYIGSRLYSPAEEEGLSKTFGPAWGAYRRKVLLPWL